MNKLVSKLRARAGKIELKQVLSVILAALFCFIGPTYFVAMASGVISQTYAVTLGFICFLIGIALIFRLVKE